MDSAEEFLMRFMEKELYGLRKEPENNKHESIQAKTVIQNRLYWKKK